MMKRLLALSAFAAVAFSLTGCDNNNAGGDASGGVAAADGGSGRPFVDSLRNAFYVKPCCAAPLAKCMEEKPNCAIAPRLNSFLAWMDSSGRFSDARMAEQLRDRHTIFADSPLHDIDNSGWPVDGDPNAPLTISVYYMATCPMCKINYRELHREVTEGQLKGKVKIVSKPLGANNPANLAVMAAAEMGKFSDFMLAIAQRGGRVDSTMINAIADSLKLDKNTFKRNSEDPMLKKRIELSDAEARKNGVTYTPFYFIGGRRYTGELQARWVIDAIEIEYENIKGKK